MKYLCGVIVCDLCLYVYHCAGLWHTHPDLSSNFVSSPEPHEHHNTTFDIIIVPLLRTFKACVVHPKHACVVVCRGGGGGGGSGFFLASML